MGCYYTLCHSTYAYSLLFYKVYMKRENAGSWNSGLEKEKILETYSAHLQKSWNFTGARFRIYKKLLGERSTRGGPPTIHEGGGAPYPPRRVPLPRGPPGRPPVPIFCYMKSFLREKNQKQAYGTRLRRHEAEPWRNQSRAPTELFCRGNFPPGGGNHRHRHHQRSSHREGVNLHQHLHQHHLLSNPSSSLVFDLCLRTSDWYPWVASSVDYSS